MNIPASFAQLARAKDYLCKDYLVYDNHKSFLNRSEDLGLLRQRIDNHQAEFLVVYGRRRVGKTELLTKVAEDQRAFYFEATDTVVPEQLNDITAALAYVSGNDLLAAQPLANWGAVLAAVTQFVGTTPTLVVFDEFQYLAKRSPELETTLSRWWRTTGRDLPITLILAGSEISFFEDEVLAGQLYGRRTGQLRVQPFRARDAALFHPDFDFEDRVRAFSICGGIPYYLDRFTGRRPLATDLMDEVFSRTGLLHDEAELMLRQSISDPTNHIGVLRSIAAGQNRNNEIVGRTHLTPVQVGRVVDTLTRLGLVERLQPVTAAPKSKKTAYAVRDQFLRFHYRFLEPARSQLRTTKLAANYLQGTVLPQLDEHTSIAWEEVCREFVEDDLPEAAAVGRWWGRVPTGEERRTEEREVDVVAVDGDRKPLAIGSCKWTNVEVDFDELNLLDRVAPHIENHHSEVRRYLFSRSGFTTRLIAHADSDPRLRLVTPADIYQ